MTEAHWVVPAAVADEGRPSGGNVYDRRVCTELTRQGWTVQEHLVGGAWPQPDAPALNELAGVLARIPDGAGVVIDGLLASPADEVVVLEASRLRLVVLVHLPLGSTDDTGALDDAGLRERRVVDAATAVVVTSEWSRGRLAELYGGRPGGVAVATPGVDPGALAEGSRPGGVLLCVAALVPAKGHDVLLGALGRVADLSWRCTCVGALDLDPAHVARLKRQAEASAITERVHFAGVMGRDELAGAFAGADLLVLPSRAETYGMVVTEALAHGVPVVTTDVGGVREALGGAREALGGVREALGGAREGLGDDGPGLAGLLVPPGDEAALAGALRAWLEDPQLRDRLRRCARARRATLSGWGTTARSIGSVLLGTGAMHEPDPEGIRVPRADP